MTGDRCTDADRGEAADDDVVEIHVSGEAGTPLSVTARVSVDGKIATLTLPRWIEPSSALPPPVAAQEAVCKALAAFLGATG